MKSLTPFFSVLAKAFESVFVPENDSWTQYTNSEGFYDEHGTWYPPASEETKQFVDAYIASLPDYEQSSSSESNIFDSQFQTQCRGYTDIDPVTGELVSFPDDPAEIDKIFAAFTSITGLTWHIPQTSESSNGANDSNEVATSVAMDVDPKTTSSSA